MTTKHLYEEVLADVRVLKAAAEDEAKRAVLEAVVPRIRELIEQQLLDETSPMSLSKQELLGLSDEEEDIPPCDPIQQSATEPVAPVPPVVVDEPEPMPCEPVAKSQTVEPAQSNDLPIEPVEPPVPVDDGVKQAVIALEVSDDEEDLEESVKRLEAQLTSIRLTNRRLTETRQKSDRISATLARVRDMYDRVQRSVDDQERKGSLGLRLESLNKRLLQLKESTMRRLREADEDLDLDLGGDEGADPKVDEKELTIKVKGLDVDPDALDNASVELVSDDSEESEEEESDDLDLDLDVSDEGSPEDDEATEEEDEELTDESVLEIDESVLRRELQRMRKLNESEAQKPVAKKGDKPGPKEFDDFGDAKSAGDPTKVKLTTESEKEDEEEDSLEECSEMEETDDTQEECAAECEEALQRESRFRTFLRRKMTRLQKELSEAKGDRRQQLKRSFLNAKKSLNESKARSQKQMKRLSEAKNPTRSNTPSQQHTAETSAAEESLRKQLAESNLLNTKLVLTNKLLQNESLSARHKAAIVERLDEAKSVKEAKLVYETLLKRLSRKSDKLTESRVVGSSSQVTRSAGMNENDRLDESIETSRWATLAGLK